jgi:hypothetical protein
MCITKISFIHMNVTAKGMLPMKVVYACTCHMVWVTQRSLWFASRNYIILHQNTGFVVCAWHFVYTKMCSNMPASVLQGLKIALSEKQCAAKWTVGLHHTHGYTAEWSVSRLNSAFFLNTRFAFKYINFFVAITFQVKFLVELEISGSLHLLLDTTDVQIYLETRTCRIMCYV